MTTLSTRDAHQWAPSHYLLIVTVSECQHCRRKTQSSELFLVCDRRGKYAGSTTKRLGVTRYPLAYMNIARKRKLAKRKTPACLQCWKERDSREVKSPNRLVVLREGRKVHDNVEINLEELGL